MLMLDSALLEDAADELGRIEVLAATGCPALGAALRLAAVRELTRIGDRERALPLDVVLAAAADPLHDAALPAAALQWRVLLETEERRVRGGAPLTSQRFAVVAPTLATYTDRARLEATWRETGRGRAVIARALEAAAWAPARDVAEAGAALVLCAGGRTDRVRFLPFGDVPDADAEAARSAWREGDEGPWTVLGLAALAQRARAVRRALDVAWRRRDTDDAALDALGRAAITARRALGHFEAELVTTMPRLADALGTSRPAAADALERLVAAGIAREVTGRARDRVYAYEAALPVASAASGA